MRRKNLAIFFALVYVVTVAVFFRGITEKETGADRLTAMCLASSLPCMDLVAEDGPSGSEDADRTLPVSQASSETSAVKGEKSEAEKVKKNSKKPRVLIYHTHATESYLPASEGNYHTVREENTVRDAGNVLAEVLEENGIAVVHDKTIHDNPSYDASYERSFETVKTLLKKYPSIECIIDLHRDATAAEIAGPVQSVKGKNSAVYSYVLSNTTETYGQNRAFLGKLNTIAESRFDGYTGNILERPYWYNQELSGKSVLIEMGNNRNNIREVRRCAEIFGEVLASALNG